MSESRTQGDRREFTLLFCVELRLLFTGNVVSTAFFWNVDCFNIASCAHGLKASIAVESFRGFPFTYTVRNCKMYSCANSVLTYRHFLALHFCTKIQKPTKESIGNRIHRWSDIPSILRLIEPITLTQNVRSLPLPVNIGTLKPEAFVHRLSGSVHIGRWTPSPPSNFHAVTWLVLWMHRQCITLLID